MPLEKTPGPDGYTKEFLVASWEVVGRYFVVAVQSYFQFGFMPHGVNATVLSLIPKKVNARTMRDYRPIACCNRLYKVISKTITHRLKTLLPDLIQPNQSAFIQGRLLLENVLLATEIVKDYQKDSIYSRSALKIDITKAFNTVR